MKLSIPALALALSFSFTQVAAAKTEAAHKMLKPDEIKFGAAPEALPPGVKMAVLTGDPTKSGMFIVRLNMPPNYQIPPHTHPYDENVTVISGKLMLGMGKARDEASMKTLEPGSFANLPGKMAHYAGSMEGAVVEIAGMGPLAINYINPSDDPRKAKQATHQ